MNQRINIPIVLLKKRPKFTAFIDDMSVLIRNVGPENRSVLPRRQSLQLKKQKFRLTAVYFYFISYNKIVETHL
jgi:hypothetical protein